jgi:hypothetical protein
VEQAGFGREPQRSRRGGEVADDATRRGHEWALCHAARPVEHQDEPSAVARRGRAGQQDQAGRTVGGEARRPKAGLDVVEVPARPRLTPRTRLEAVEGSPVALEQHDLATIQDGESPRVGDEVADVVGLERAAAPSPAVEQDAAVLVTEEISTPSSRSPAMSRISPFAGTDRRCCSEASR